MSAWGSLLFNLGVNAAGSFLGAAALTALAARALGASDGAWRRWFWLIPPVKVALDCARGVPEGAFFWARLAGARQELGSFRLGFGLEAPALPTVHLGLGAQSGGRTFAQSVAEPLATALDRHAGAHAAATLGVALAAGSLLLLLRSAWHAAGAVRAARRARSAGVVVERRRAGGRAVEIRVTSGRGSPFAGGLLRPYVCIPREVHEALSDDEREAVIAHELAHIASLDLVLVTAVAVVADLFWFVPGLRPWCRAALAQIELAADAHAVARGVAPVTLASALVRVAEIARHSPAPTLALLRPHPALARRVRRLLDAPRRPRWLALSPATRALLTAWVAAAILASSTFGNH